MQYGPTVNLQNRRVPPNVYNAYLDRQAEVLNEIARNGGLTRICCMQGNRPEYNRAPWVWMPQQGRRFNELATLAVPAAASENTDLVVLSHRVPVGYDGVIVQPVNQFIGTGFVEASGDITWRLKVNRRWVKDYGQITTSLGSMQTGPTTSPGFGIRLYSGDLVQYFANFATGATARCTGKVLCAVQGWFYPQGRYAF